MVTPKAKKPATMCTAPAAPKSWKPHSTVNQPVGCQPHEAPRTHTTDPRIIAKIRNELIRIRSITAPEKIDAVVAAKSTNAPQKIPLALSARLGPILADHGSPAAAASKSGMKPLYIAR